MKKTAPHDTLLFIVDMQDGMWADNNADFSEYDQAFREALERRKLHFEKKCHEYMLDMVPPMHAFVESMRGQATPVWVTMLDEGLGDVMEGLGAKRADLRLEKIAQKSPVPENRDLIATWKDQGYTHAIVIGAFAGECVRATAKDLHRDLGFKITVIPDLLIYDRPGDDDELANALNAIEKAGARIQWLEDMERPARLAADKGEHLKLDL